MSRPPVRQLVLISVLSLVNALSALAGADTIICVDDDVRLGGDGKSWASAHRFLQDAIKDAEGLPPGMTVEIRVAQGIYKPDRNSEHPEGTGDQGASFILVTGMTLKGGFAGLGSEDPNAWDVDKYVTMLSGDLAGDDVDDGKYLGFEPTRRENSWCILKPLENNTVEAVLVTGAMESALRGVGHLVVLDCSFLKNGGFSHDGAAIDHHASVDDS